jgi:hypothetical protein
MVALEEFGVGFNEFWRRMPTELGLLTNLKYLNLEENRLSGTLPTEIALLTNLETILLSKNLMIGSVPTQFQQLTNLKEFRLANTGLGGVFPTELVTLTNLNRLEMGGNNFKGMFVIWWFSYTLSVILFSKLKTSILIASLGTVMTEFGLMTGLSWLSMNE